MYANLDSTDVDAITLMWWMHRRVDVGRLPHDRVVIQFDHTAPKRCSFWVVIEQGAASVCLQDPGHEVDAVVTCTTPALARVFSGVDTWREAVTTRWVRARCTSATLFTASTAPTNKSIGTAASSGCIRLTNDDVIDLYSRVRIGATVIVQ